LLRHRLHIHSSGLLGLNAFLFPHLLALIWCSFAVHLLLVTRGLRQYAPFLSMGCPSWYRGLGTCLQILKYAFQICRFLCTDSNQLSWFMSVFMGLVLKFLNSFVQISQLALEAYGVVQPPEPSLIAWWPGHCSSLCKFQKAQADVKYQRLISKIFKENHSISDSPDYATAIMRCCVQVLLIVVTIVPVVRFESA